MTKSVNNRQLLQVLVSIYNQSIQTYHHFPEVILCGRQRLDPDAFKQLLEQNLVVPYKADSFGQFYRLSKKGEAHLFQALLRRKPKPFSWSSAQGRFAFAAV